MKRERIKHLMIYTLAAPAALMVSSAVQANVVSASSAANAGSGTISATVGGNTIPLTIGPLAPASGSAPPAYNESNSTASLGIPPDVASLLGASTGLLQSQAQGTTANNGNAQASTTGANTTVCKTSRV